MAFQSHPEPMNASSHHSKVKVTLTLSDPTFVAGGHISGKMEVDSRPDPDSVLGIGIMMVELYAIEEIISRDHSATSTFIHSRRVYQGPGLPPSNAVFPDHVPAEGDIQLPAHHFAARRGLTTFFFRFPLPHPSPASISFGPANIKYEVRASVSVAWRGDRRLVTEKREVTVVESLDALIPAEMPQAITVADGGKLWTQANIVNGAVIGGEVACIDLQVKNNTTRWTGGIILTLTRTLYLSSSLLAGKPPLEVSDVVTQVDFRGPEYSVPPGIEGIASLVIDIPRHSRGTGGDPRLDDNGKKTDCLFEVRCAFNIRVEMPQGSGDVILTLPVVVHHSLAIPEVAASPVSHPYIFPSDPGVSLSPPPAPNMLPYPTGSKFGSPWSPPPTKPIYDYSPSEGNAGYAVHPWQLPYPVQRCTSTGPPVPVPYYDTGLLIAEVPPIKLLPLPPVSLPRPGHPLPVPSDTTDPVCHTDLPGRGPRASRISYTLHQSVRHRSVSPSLRAHPLPEPLIQVAHPHQGHLPTTPIPSLPNFREPQSVIRSPRPTLSSKHSFSEPIPKSGNVFVLEHMVDEVSEQTGYPSADPSTGDAGLGGAQGSFPYPNVDSLPSVPSGRDRTTLSRCSRTVALLGEKAFVDRPPPLASSNNFPRAPPTPPIAAITPIKFPRAPADLSAVGAATLGKQVTEESGLDALERRLIAEVGTRRLDTDAHPDVRGVVRPITIPCRDPPDGVNDSAISSLTLADRDAVVKGPGQEREQELDHDSDERTQHVGGGQIPSDDDRDARTQKGKSVLRIGKSRHSDEEPERSRQRERKKGKVDDSRKLRREAQGRVTAWLDGIDTATPPVVDDSLSVTSPSASHFVPFTAGESLRSSSPREGKAEDPPGLGTDAKNVSAAPNPRSSGFVTISTLEATRGSIAPSFKQSPRRSSANDALQSSLLRQVDTRAVHRPDPAGFSADLQSIRHGHPLSPGQIDEPALRVTQMASIWAVKASATEANTKKNSAGPPPSRRPIPNIFKHSVGKTPVSAALLNGSDTKYRIEPHTNPPKATTVPAVISSSHAVPMLSSTASLARPQIANKPKVTNLAPMVSETVSDIKSMSQNTVAKPGRQFGDLAFGKARLKALIQKYQG